MTKTISMVEARKKLTSLPEALEQEQDVGAIVVTRRGKPVLALMPWELYEAITETLDILGDKDLMALLRQSIKEAEAGKTMSWSEAKRKLKL